MAISASLLIVDMGTLGFTITRDMGSLRAVVGFIFVIAVPGWAVVGHLALRRPAAEVVLTLSSSLAISVVVAEVMLLVGRWQPGTATVAVSLVAGGSLAVQVWRLCADAPAAVGRQPGDRVSQQ